MKKHHFNISKCFVKSIRCMYAAFVVTITLWLFTLIYLICTAFTKHQRLPPLWHTWLAYSFGVSLDSTQYRPWTALTHWGRDKMAAISQTTFSNAFSWMNTYEFRIRFHWILFLMVEITICKVLMVSAGKLCETGPRVCIKVDTE